MVPIPEPSRALIVDPEGRSRLRIWPLLEGDGFVVEESDDFDDVADRLAAGIAYDVIVTEAGRRGEGAAMAERVSDADPTVATILVRDPNPAGDALRATRPGAFHVLDSRFSEREWRQTIARICARRDLLAGRRHEEEQVQGEIERREQGFRGLLDRARPDAAPSDGDAAREGYGRFAGEAFDLDTFAVLVPTSLGLRPAFFADRHGRPLDASVLSSDSGLSRTLAWNTSGHGELPGDGHLVKGNRGAAFWAFSSDAGAGAIYAGADSRDVAIRDRDAGVFAVFRSRLIDHLRESFRDSPENGQDSFLGEARRFIRSLEVQTGGEHTPEHAVRVERYATLLGRQSGRFDSTGAFRLAAAAILHDVGKIGPETSRRRWTGHTRLRTHPVVGGRIVRALRDVDLEPAVRHHHEHYDGTGYPDALHGDEIPPEAQIVAVSDAFDHLTSAGLSTDLAIEELVKCSGRRYSPEVIALVRSSAGELRRIGQTKPEEPSTDLARAS